MSLKLILSILLISAPAYTTEDLGEPSGEIAAGAGFNPKKLGHRRKKAAWWDELHASYRSLARESDAPGQVVKTKHLGRS
jgi:hypothetical protein